MNISARSPLCLFALVFLGALGSNASALSVTIERIEGYQKGYGGEFLATPDADLAYLLDGYSPLAKLNDGFFTFCLERDAPIPFKKPHRAVVNDVVLGVGGRKGGDNGADAVSNGTAWLYGQFATGVLEGYDYTAGNRSKARKLQTAIWWLEGEVSLARPKKNEFVRLAIEHFSGREFALADNDGSFNVQVLNLGRNSAIQDMLVYTPERPISVPEGGKTLALLSLSLLALTLLHWKAQVAALVRG